MTKSPGIPPTKEKVSPMRNKDPDKWIGLMNNFRMCAREMVIKDIIEE